MLVPLLSSIISGLLIAYYATVVLQLFGITRITDNELSFKGLIPFYYWFKLKN